MEDIVEYKLSDVFCVVWSYSCKHPSVSFVLEQGK